MSFIMVYTTHPNQPTANQIIETMTIEKLVACGNSFPITSAYWWKGIVEREGEWVAILKTIPENWESVQLRIQELHPYEVPCIIKMEVEANQAYENWIRESVVENDGKG